MAPGSAELSPAGAGQAKDAAAASGKQSASFGGTQLLQELHDRTHFSLAELGALRERFAAHGAAAPQHAGPYPFAAP